MTYDAVVIGGGFYGAAIAAHLRARGGFENVIIVEREQALLQRASYNNQARVHNGYHYPRDFTTAARSRQNLSRFVHAYHDAVVKCDRSSLYAISRLNSRVTANQFRRFCQEIGAYIEPATAAQRKLFDPRLIEDVFLVEEHVFDARRLAEAVNRDLSMVEAMLGTQVTGINSDGENLLVRCDNGAHLLSRFVFNCTYSGLCQFGCTRTHLKHEIAEMALVQVPDELAQLSVTVMDGPFFSFIPFPDRGMHTLSHVRYTPHLSWADNPDIDPYQRLREYGRPTNFEYMIRDVGRYMPLMRGTRYVDSLFEVKTVLTKNEGNDGRPILLERHPQHPNMYSILGSKIDNIYDIIEKLETEVLCQRH